MPEGVAGPDLTIPTMYQEFALFAAGYFPSPLSRLRLGVVHRGRSMVALAFDRPFAFMGQDVLIFSRHRFTLHG
jgi:hypothetical protein